ncbi:hypothetical protein FRC20_002788 [Serendipita sp. 405]|nr:hypothetical protein FRC20_002788 [Serendipita sp. 405]
MTILSRFYRLNPHETGLDSRVEKGAATSNRHGSRLPQWAARLHSRFSQLSLSSRDDLHIQSPDKELMRNSLIWLSNHISISSAVYKRLLVLVNGFASVIDETGDPSNWVNVPWNEIMHVLGTIYTSFVQNLDLDEEAFTEFARETQCLRQSGMQEITGFKLFNGDIEVEGLDFPARLLYTWTTSLSLHDSDVLRKQRFSDEVTIQNSIGLITSTPHELLKIWYELLSGDVQACERILPNLLSKITPSRREGLDQRLDVLLYLISVGELPWASTVPVPVQGSIKYIPSNPLIRRLRIIDWLDSLNQYPQKEEIIRQMRHIATETGQRTLLARYKLTDAEEAELKRMGCINVDRWKRPEPRLHSALVTFDQMLSSAGNQMSKSKRIMLDAMVEIIAIDLDDCKFLFDPKYFSEEEPWMLLELQSLSSSILSAIACATLGIEWKEEGEEGSLRLSTEGSSLGDRSLRRLAEVCFVDPPFINGDCTGLWLLRFQLWTHITLASAPAIYLQKLVIDLDSLKRVEEEIQSTRLGIAHAGDFILALYHFHYSYEWGNSNDRSLTLIPDIVVGNETSVDSTIASKECIDYLASICHDIRDEPARLIRLLIELLQADINYKPRFRRPSNLLSLLKHAKAHLASKELRSFAPSCSRLIEYIRESHGQFEDSWNDVIGRDYMRNDPRPHYERVDRSELKTVCDEVIALLEPEGAWDGEKVDVSWPKYLLRPKGREWIPLDEEVDDHQLYSNNLFVDTSPEVIREAVVRSETSVDEETE